MQLRGARLLAAVRVDRLDKGHVIWDQFTQPFRPQRDYSGFGAFVFGERQYRMAVAEVAAAVA